MRKIALATGGYSKEASVSYKSAKNIKQALDSLFDVFWIDITPDAWTCEKNGEKVPVDKNDFSVTLQDQKICFDFVFICIHGTPGEDGKLQSYLEMLHIPYTFSCNSVVSMMTFNKNYAKSFLHNKGIFTPKESYLQINHPYNIEDIKKLGLPLFVKPNNSGSSLGVSKIKSWDDLQPAIDAAFGIDNEVLIEEAITGREFTVGVFESDKGITVLPITEILSLHEFFDFDAKYNGASKEVTPANITKKERTTLEHYAKDIYRLLQCQGVVRIDFIWHEQKQVPFFLEVNTIPGFTNVSLVPQQIKCMGLSQTEFLNIIIQQTLHNQYGKKTCSNIQPIFSS